jgi:nucleoside-diphosphate-sugar epimerase
MKVLVTGLDADHELTALNRSAVDGLSTHRADIADFESIRSAFDGQDAVIHLAAKAGENYAWEELRDTNVSGTFNVLRAAAEAGVKRVVFASSGATVAGWEVEQPYRTLVEGRYDEAPAQWRMIGVDEPTRPRGVYGSTKVWGEALARHFCDTTQLSVLSLRIGFVNAEDKPANPRQFSVWCSQRDVVQMIELALHAPASLHWGVFFANSDNRWSYRDLSHSRQVLGFEPLDAAEQRR